MAVISAYPKRNGPHCVSAPTTELARPPAAGEIGRYQDVDLDTLELVRPRSIGVEQAALCVMRQCSFEAMLTELGFSRRQVTAAVGTVVGRMAKPGSNRRANRQDATIQFTAQSQWH